MDPAFYAGLRAHFSDDQILDLGMTIAFASGWQRFIDAFGIVPDRFTEHSPSPFQPLPERALSADRRPAATGAQPLRGSRRRIRPRPLSVSK